MNNNNDEFSGLKQAAKRSFVNDSSEKPSSSDSDYEKPVISDEDTIQEERTAFENVNLSADMRERLEDMSFDDLMKTPLPGSIISRIKVMIKKNDFKKRSMDYLGEVALDEMLITWVSSEIKLPIYIIMRLVMPHAVAYEYAESYSKGINTEAEMFKTISELTTFDIKKREDLSKIFKKIAIYHPFIAKVVKSMTQRKS